MCLKRLSQHLVGDKPVRYRSNPPGMRTVQSPTGHQKVCMGGKILIPAKGMDDRHNARQIAFVCIPFLKRLMGNCKEHVVVGSLAKLEVSPKLRGGMEDNVFVGRIGKEQLKLFLPAFGLGDT